MIGNCAMSMLRRSLLSLKILQLLWFPTISQSRANSARGLELLRKPALREVMVANSL